MSDAKSYAQITSCLGAWALHLTHWFKIRIDTQVIKSSTHQEKKQYKQASENRCSEFLPLSLKQVTAPVGKPMPATQRRQRSLHVLSISLCDMHALTGYSLHGARLASQPPGTARLMTRVSSSSIYTLTPCAIPSTPVCGDVHTATYTKHTSIQPELPSIVQSAGPFSKFLV